MHQLHHDCFCTANLIWFTVTCVIGLFVTHVYMVLCSRSLEDLLKTYFTRVLCKISCYLCKHQNFGSFGRFSVQSGVHTEFDPWTRLHLQCARRMCGTKNTVNYEQFSVIGFTVHKIHIIATAIGFSLIVN